MADFIVNKIKNAETMKAVIIWFNIGMEINSRLVNNDNYLN